MADRIVMRWPQPDEYTVYGPEFAQSLIGQETRFEGRPAKVIDAELNKDGSVSVTVEYEGDPPEPIKGYFKPGSFSWKSPDEP